MAGIAHAEHQEPVKVEYDDAPEQAEDHGRGQRRLNAVAQREDHRYHGDTRCRQQHSGHLDESRALLRHLVQNGLVTASEPGHEVSPAPDHSRSPSWPAAAWPRAGRTSFPRLAFPTFIPAPSCRLHPAARLLVINDPTGEFLMPVALVMLAVAEKQAHGR